MAKGNPFRFSTKYQDDETDLLYFGYRYYDASKGRWLSKDPVGEIACPALYAFVRNSPCNLCDVLGLYDDDDDPNPKNVGGNRTCCCTCVKAVTIDEVTKLAPAQDKVYGHFFTVTIYLENKIAGKWRKWLTGEPKLIWKERSDHPPITYNGRVHPNEWAEISNLFPHFGIWSNWRNRDRTCPNPSVVVRISDAPTYYVGRPDAPSRVIDFEVTAKSAFACDCIWKSITVRAKQVISGPEIVIGTIRTQKFDVQETTYR
jgi:RHS repeat-associated protein